MSETFKNKELHIVVNGVPQTTSQKKLSFTDLVAFAFGSSQAGSTITFTVTYRKGQGNKPEGTVDPDGGTVRIHEGMIFNVTKTDKS